jgi:hypothetical protein
LGLKSKNGAHRRSCRLGLTVAEAGEAKHTVWELTAAETKIPYRIL